MFILPAYHATCSKDKSSKTQSAAPCAIYSYCRLTTPYAARVSSQKLRAQNSKRIIKTHWRLIVQSQAGLSKLRIDSNMNHKDQGNMARTNFKPYINTVQKMSLKKCSKQMQIRRNKAFIGCQASISSAIQGPHSH